MSRTFIVLLAIVLVPVSYVVGSAVLEPEPDFEIDMSERMSDSEIVMATEWLQDFRDSCPTLFTKLKGHTSDASVEVWEAMPYRAEQYGWEKEVVFSVKISNDSRVASGHTVTYHISRNGTPGWLTQKSQGAEACGKNATPGSETFVGF